MTKKHSRLAASAASRWLACPGSITLAEKFDLKGTTSKYATEGTAAHTLGETCLRLEAEPLDFVGSYIEADGVQVEVTEDMAEAVKVYVDYVNSNTLPMDYSWLEQRCGITEELGGTADCIIAKWRYACFDLEIIDYKHGRGMLVSPERNPQLMIYALGGLVNTPIEVPIDKVTLTVVQPRAEGQQIKSWETTAADLHAWQQERLMPGAERALSGSEILHTGDHCRFCPALAICPEHKAAALEVARADFETCTFPPPETLSPVHVAKVLKFAEMMSGWVQQVKAFAVERMEQGERVPGYKLVQKRRTRAWLDERKMVEALGEDAYQKKVRTVAQAEKAVGKEGLEGLWEWNNTGLTIAPESDKRQAVANSAILDFTDEKE